MKKQILTLLFICSSLLAFSQLDYRKMKDTICPNYCGFLDSITLNEIYTALLNLDTIQITKGLADYYDDLSHIQYDLHLLYDEDTALMRLSLRSTEKSLYHDPKRWGMIWNAAFANVVFGDCERAHFYLERYRKVYPKRYLKKPEMQQQIAILLEMCPNEELKKKFKIKDKKN